MGGHGLQTITGSDSRVAYSNDSNPQAFGVLELALNSSGANFEYINTSGTILDSGVIPCNKGGADTQAPNVPSGLTANATSATQVNLTCVRCLEPFSHPLDFEIAERYLFSPRDVAEESDHLIAPDGTIDLTEPTRQQIWVSLPIQPLCRSDCQGLCAQCGVNLNFESCTCQEETIDPRLAALKELL